MKGQLKGVIAYRESWGGDLELPLEATAEAGPPL